MNVRKMAFIGVLAIGSMSFLAANWQSGAKNAEGASDAREIQVTAKKYEFSPNPIRVKKGEHVRLIITATDRDHGFKLEAFHISQKLKKGEPSTVEFTPDKAGTFPFKCSVFCGFGHGGMKGTIVAEE